jgi:hypothetical protein
MAEYELSNHASTMLKERGIYEEWLQVTLDSPARQEINQDGIAYFFRTIP